MRIAHVISSLKRGGAETVLASLINHSLLNTDEHHVIYFHDGPLKKAVENHNVRLYHIPYGPLFFCRFVYRLFVISPTVVHASLWFAIACSAVAGFVLRIPVMAVFHNNIDQNSRYKNYIDWLVLRLVKRYVAVSEFVAQSLCKYHPWLDRSQITVMHNGVDMPVATVQPSREKFALPADAVVIGTVGRFEAVKRIPWLIDCFAQLHKNHTNLYLLLIGTGSQEQMLREYVEQKGIAQYVRFIVDQNAYNLYPLFDIFTLTSENEGISIALLEAMSYGKACVVTNVIPEHSVIVHGHNGLVIPAHDAQLFCSQVAELIHNPVLRKAFGDHAYTTVAQQFSRDAMVTHYKALFNELTRL